MKESGKSRGIRWYQFIIYFYLYASALIGLLVGVGEVTGVVYLGMAKVFYAIYPMLQVVNVFFGVVQILLAAAAVYIRRQLVAWRQGAPRLLLLYQGFSLLYYVTYLVGTTLVLEELAVDWLSGAYIALQALLLVVNGIYFHRRKEMFDM